MTIQVSDARRALLVEDDKFVSELISSLVRSLGYETACVSTVSDAVIALDTFDPDVLLVDLDLGVGPTGLDLLDMVQQRPNRPAAVILSGHRSPELVRAKRFTRPADLIYLVKQDITSAQMVAEALDAALTQNEYDVPEVSPTGRRIVEVTPAQASVLRMMAAGMSNRQIAEERGSTMRAVEQLVHRTFSALGLSKTESLNPRVEAVRMYRNAEVVVR